MTAALSLFDWAPPAPPPPVAIAPAPAPTTARADHLAASRDRACALLPANPVMAVCSMVRDLRANAETAGDVADSVAFSLRALAATNSVPAARAFVEDFA